MSTLTLTDDYLKTLRIQLSSVTSEPYATGKALQLLDEVERLRAEEDAEGREIGQLHDALETYRNKLATARAALERITKVNVMVYVAKDIARKALEEIK